MALRVKKNTFMYEEVNPHGDLVRREVFAGQLVPDHYIEGEDTESGAVEESDVERGPGLGAGAHGYPHQRGVSVKDQLESKLGRKPTDEEVDSATYGGQATADLEQQAKDNRAAARRKGGSSVSRKSPGSAGPNESGE